MKKHICVILALLLLGLPVFGACGKEDGPQNDPVSVGPEAGQNTETEDPSGDIPGDLPGDVPLESEGQADPGQAEEPAEAPSGAGTAEPETEQDLHAEAIDSAQAGLQKLGSNFFYAKVGDCGFSAFLEAGGASSDREVLAFLSGMLYAPGLDFRIPGAGCSTISAASPDGGRFFGRNFDWSCREVLLLEAHPDGGYASFSTVNVDFLKESASAKLSDEALCAAAY
ncbi:MAG: hypothetical protein IKX19_10085, partial [Clostridia bacterium]|nr:hypothetical protein [Clostridia bacterium]